MPLINVLNVVYQVLNFLYGGSVHTIDVVSCVCVLGPHVLVCLGTQCKSLICVSSPEGNNGPVTLASCRVQTV